MGVVSVSAEQVREKVSMPQAIAAVRQGFIDLAAGHFEMPTRTALRDGQFLDMACHHRPSATTMFKLLSLNFTGRQPAILGSVVWSDLESTQQLVADATAVTTLRTGAVSGVATDLLAPPDAGRLVVIGTGAQAADQARAVHAVRPLAELVLVGRDPGRADALATLMAEELGSARVEATVEVEAALGTAEIVCCSTTATAPLFALDALPARVHVNAIGSFRPTMRELPDALLGDGLVVIDERDSILEESGEILHALDAGVLRIEDLVELGVALTAGVEPTARTTFKSVGVAMQDWAIGQLLADAFLRR